MKTPDLPGSFIAAIAGNVVAVAVAFGAPLTGDQQKALLALAVTLGSVLVTAGAWLHGKRAANADKIAAAKVGAQRVTPASAASGVTKWELVAHPATSSVAPVPPAFATTETDPAPAAAAAPAAKKKPATKRLAKS